MSPKITRSSKKSLGVAPVVLVSCSGELAVHSCSLVCVAKLGSEVFLVLVFIA